MSNVIKLNNRVTKNIEISADNVIEGAQNIGYRSMIICGFDKDHNFILQSNMAKKSDILYCMKMLEHKLMNGDYDDIDI